MQATVKGYCHCAPSLPTVAFLGFAGSLLRWGVLGLLATKKSGGLVPAPSLARGDGVVRASVLRGSTQSFGLDVPRSWHAEISTELCSVLRTTANTAECNSIDLAARSVHVVQLGIVFEQICVALHVFYNTVFNKLFILLIVTV